MRTHGHREGSITHWGLSEDEGLEGGIALGETPNVDDRLIGAANHLGTCIPMQQTCMFHICISELNV